MDEHDDTAITHADHDAETYVGSTSDPIDSAQKYHAGAPSYWSSQEPFDQPSPRKQHGTAQTFVLISVVALLTFVGVRFLVPSPASDVSFEQRAVPGQTVTPQPDITMPKTVSQCLAYNGISSPPTEMRSVPTSSVTCGYAMQVVNAVKKAKEQNPNAARFNIAPYSEYEKETVPLSCLTSGKITHCVGGRHVDVYITL